MCESETLFSFFLELTTGNSEWKMFPGINVLSILWNVYFLQMSD